MDEETFSSFNLDLDVSEQSFTEYDIEEEDNVKDSVEESDNFNHQAFKSDVEEEKMFTAVECWDEQRVHDQSKFVEEFMKIIKDNERNYGH